MILGEAALILGEAAGTAAELIITADRSPSILMHLVLALQGETKLLVGYKISAAAFAAVSNLVEWLSWLHNRGEGEA